MKKNKIFLTITSGLLAVILLNRCSNVVGDALGEPFDSGWVGVNNDDSVGIAPDNIHMSIEPAIAAHNTKLYAAWFMYSPDACINVAVYNGDNDNPAWSSAGKISYTNNNSRTPSLISFNGKLYLFWTDGYTPVVRAAVYNNNDSSPSWNFVDGNSDTGLNYDSTHTAFKPSPFVFNSKLYLSWIESYQARIAVYNSNDSSPSWSFVDGNGIYGINKDPDENAYTIQLASLNGKLYAGWIETSTDYNYPPQMRVAVYNGNDLSPVWTSVDGNTYKGINRDPLNSAYCSSFFSADGKLYAVWVENTSYIQQIRAAVYNENDSSPAWIFIDGNHTDRGLNYQTSRHAERLVAAVHNSKVYLAWQDNKQIHVSEFNGDFASPSWRFIDGGSSKYGINCMEYSFGEQPALASYNSFLYCIFIYDPTPSWFPYVKYWAAE